MKQPFTTYCKPLLLALALGTGYTSQGQVTYSQVPLTAASFTADVIANGTAAQPPASSTTADADGVGYFFISQDYYTATTPHTSGLPNSGLIPNSIAGASGLTYQLASYSANNSLRLPGASSGSVTFATPTAAAEVYVLGSSGSSASTATITVNYSDGTTTAFAGQTYPDWFTTSTAQNVFGMSARASATVPISVLTAANTAPFLDQLKLTIPAAKVTTPITSVTVANTTAASVLQIMAVSIGTYPACSAVPTTVTTAATTTSGGTTALTSACAATSIYLSLSGITVQTGYTYQWQSSPNGTTWTNIAGATNPTYVATGQTAATYYRAQVGCANAGTTLASSTPVQIAQTPVLNCYCTPVTSGLGSDGITNVTLGTLVSNSSTTNSSPYYTDYSAVQTAGTLAVPTLLAGGTATVSVTMGSDGQQYSGVWIDFDRNGSFDTSEFFTLGTNAGSNGTSLIPITIPSGALSGQTKMRVRGGDDVVLLATQSCTASSSASNYGEVEDYLVSVVAPTPCAGTPPASTAVATATTACAATSFTLSATGVATGTTGLTYQWQSKLATATTFANISAATAATYTVVGQAAATDYRLVVTCTASTQSATSNTVSVAQSPLSACYCTAVSTGTNEYIKGVTLPGAPGFTNTTGANSPNGYGDFTANAAYTTTMVRGTNNNVSVTVRSNAAGSQGGLWVDYNQNGLFDASEYTLVGTSSLSGADVTFPVSLVVPTTALAGPTRMRVRWRNSAFTSADACLANAATGCTTGCAWYGETEDYLVTISATPLATNSANAAAKLALFPNPTQSAATLTGADAGTTVQVLDVLGRVLLTAKADATGKAALALPTGLAKGVYLVRAGQMTTRLVVE